MKRIKRCVVCAGTIFLLTASSVYAGDHSALKQDIVQKNVKDVLTQAKEKIIQEAIDAVKSTYQAIGLIKSDHLEKARAALLTASKNLENITKKGEDFLPIDVYVNVASGVDNPQIAQEVLRQVKEALDQNDPQLAREFLIPLVDEIDVSVVNLPLSLYKDSVNNAIIALDEENAQRAGDLLSQGIKSFVTDTEVIPLPMIVAKSLLDKANETVNDNPQDALRLVQDAKLQLQLNELLGYGQSKAYREQAGSIKKRALSVRYGNVQKEIIRNIKMMEKAVVRETSDVGKKIKDEMNKIKGYFS